MTLDFALIGAPRSGTTSLARWLAKQPEVLLSDPKEPFYFAMDELPNLRKSQGVDNLGDYEAMFKKRRPEHRLTGEASTLYLYSQRAIQRLLAYKPDVKLVVVVREPAPLVVSFYQQMKLMGFETRPLPVAWRSSVQRQSVPDSFPDPLLSDYQRIGSVGSAIHQLLDLVEPENVRLLSMAELINDTKPTLLKLSEFLGVSAPEIPDRLPATNSARTPRGPSATFLRRPFVRKRLRRVKSSLDLRHVEGLRRLRDSMLYRPAPEVGSEFIATLNHALETERIVGSEMVAGKLGLGG